MYSIKFLGNKEFDSLPKEVTKGSKIDDSLGFYNPDLRQAYIRWTAYPEVNKYLLDHEFEHMIEDHATDSDENGIRHKKKASFLNWILPVTRAFSAAKSGDISDLAHPLAQNTVRGALKPPDQPDQQAQQADMMQQQNYMNSPAYQSIFGNPAGSQGSNASLAGGNSLGDSSQGELNQGLSQQSQNPFADQYKYGAPSGRLVF